MKTESKFFINGKIEPSFISDQIEFHQKKKNIGAHSVFLGQVRADENEKGTVDKIFYSAYVEMADKEISKIRELIIKKYKLSCLHVYHSLGEVNAGEISIFVFGSTPHRDGLFESVKETVELIKKNVPIWKKLIFTV